MRKYKSGRRTRNRVRLVSAFAAVVLAAVALAALYGLGGAAGPWAVLAAVLAALLFSVPLVLYLRARRLNAELLRRQARHDPVTGLPNRSSFMERAGRALRRADGGAVAVLLVDLDDFEEINCSLGYEAGDELLAGVGERFEEAVGPGGSVARLGGDEFIVLIEDLPERGVAVAAAERIGSSLCDPLGAGGSRVSVSASIGIALSGGAGSPGVDGENPEGLLRGARVAMRAAKRKGKARYRVFDPGATTTTSRRSLAEVELRRAVREEEFRVYYQPMVALKTGRVCAFEALVRWQHPVYGLVPPDEFVPLAEQTGLIRPIGRWVLREACRQVREWQSLRHGERQGEPGEAPLVLSANVSACQFRQPGLAEEVLDVLRETGLDPRSLKLEITESVMMHDASAVATLEELKAHGVGLAMDDFGTGYSNLSHIKRLPIGSLKIDRSFVGGLGRDAGDTAIVRATVAYADALGLNVVAEGIENAEQLASLTEMGCELGQGYHFARPLPGDEAAKLLSANLLGVVSARAAGEGPRDRR